jgi:IS5 family transposase
MASGFENFTTWMFVLIDDIWQQIAPYFSHPGPQSECSDSELMTLAIVGECRGWDKETDLIANWQEHRDMFPHLPERSRFNRRRRNLMYAINTIRHVVLQLTALAAERQCVIDSLPVPVIAFHLVPGSDADWAAYGAAFGHVASKKQTIFGYKLHLLVTVDGLILDFELAPANATDLEVGAELLAEHGQRNVYGDKGYVSAEKAAELWETRQVRLSTLPRRNQKRQLPAATAQAFNRVRQIVETVNGQLTEQFQIEVNHAHSFWGLCARLYTKLTAHTLCVHLNELLGNDEVLQIKHLVYDCN